MKPVYNVWHLPYGPKDPRHFDVMSVEHEGNEVLYTRAEARELLRVCRKRDPVGYYRIVRLDPTILPL